MAQRIPLFLVLRSSIQIIACITPNVANADRSNDMSVIAYGCINTKRKTLVNSPVLISYEFPSKKASAEKISIKPALVTEGVKPVNAIYATTNMQSMDKRHFLFIRHKENNLSISKERMARC
jgi:hypothetical protein